MTFGIRNKGLTGWSFFTVILGMKTLFIGLKRIEGRIRTFGLLGLLGLISLWGAEGNRGNPLILKEEDRVLQTLSAFKEVLNNRDIDGVLSFFSKNYRDSSRVKYRDLKGIFERFFREVRPEKNYPIFYFYNPRVRIKGDRAEVEINLIIKSKSFYREKTPLYKKALKMDLVKKHNGWKFLKMEGVFFNNLRKR